MAFRYHKYGIIIGIDFGTTFSGTCYSVTATELRDTEYPEITVVSWPEESIVENKTPSIIIYDKNFHLLFWGGAARKYIENGKLRQGQIVKERFKLVLPYSFPENGAIYKTKTDRKIEQDNKKATIDYFREIFEHTVRTIQKNIAFNHFSIEKENIRFVITVPTLWNGIQRSFMRTVAREAGLITNADHENRLLIINESSAAVLHCEQEKTALEDMVPGDKYMVCDAGGNTVDLATFEFVKSVTGDPADSFRRCQLTADSNDRCGSTLIDEKMRDLLTLFCYNGEPCNDEEERKERDGLFSPVIDKFISEIKPVFGKRSKEFKFPKCKHAKVSKTYTRSISEGPIDEGDYNDGQCIVCKEEDFKHMHKREFGDPIILMLRDARIVPKLKFHLPNTVTHKVNGGACKLKIPYDIMRTQVFEEVTKRILTLIDKQIKKPNANIERIYLVGGFGSSPYLQKRILRAFYIKDNLLPNRKYRIGTLITGKYSSSATMRGAMVYGIDGSRQKPETDIVERKFEYASTDKYNTLICLDIGYLSTSCSYRDLGNESDEMIEITNWPGLQENNFMIPTAKETVNGRTTWGAEVKHPIHPEHKKRITLSKLMSLAKAELRHYLCEFIRLVLNHVHDSISKIADRSKCRYVITMENCYQFFNNKSEMYYIAQLAGIISKEDPVERLLLISRDTAAAMYTEKEHFPSLPAYTNHVLLINMYHDICSLSLMEHTKISSADIDSTDEQGTRVFRNVRSVRSGTFDFDFTGRIVFYLNNYVSTNNCIGCIGSHSTYSSTYYAELKRGFLNYIKTELNFNNSCKTQNIPITDTKCCTASIKVYDMLEHILLPAVKDLAFEISRFATQSDMMQRFSFDKIILSGILLETNISNYKFLELIVIDYISKAMDINTDLISPSKHNGREALLGAALYGNRPEDFTERIARVSYAVNIRAFGIKEFEDKAKSKIEEEKKNSKDEDDLKNRIFSLESQNSYASDEKVELFYQPYLDTSTFNCGEDDLSYIIRRGDKILEKHQSEGILKKFYARENCIVYATIYFSEADGLPTEGIKTDNPHFRKIHQFELYVARDEDDPLTVCHFDIRFIPENNEAIFEATAGPRLGMVFDYRFKDEFLVANIYDHRQLIEVGDLTIAETS